MSKNIKRILALVMVFLMAFQLMPLNALADTIVTTDDDGVGTQGATFCTVTFYSAEDASGNRTVVAKQLYEVGSAIEEVPEVETKKTGEDGTVYVFDYWEDASLNRVDAGYIVSGNTSVVPVYTVKKSVRVTVNSKYNNTVLNTFISDYATDATSIDVELEEKYVVDGDKYVYAPAATLKINPAELFNKATYNEESKLYEVTENVEYVEADSTANIQYVRVSWDVEAKAYDFTTYDVLKTTSIMGKSGMKIEPALLTAAEENEYHVEYIKSDTDIDFSKEEDKTFNVYYAYEKVTLTYNTDGGSYVAPQAVPYGSAVTVYKGGRGALICGQSDHTHTQPSGNPGYNKTSGCYKSQYNYSSKSYEWVLNCKKTEHTHSDSCYSTIVESPIPTKTGYSFGGWYTDSACTKVASASMTLNGDVTVYAKWTPNQVNYSVVYLKEELDGNYSYIRTSVKSATVGTTVSGNDGAGSFTNSSYYHFNNDGKGNTSAPVKADASTVVYSYYDLNTYYLDFDLNTNSNSIKMTIGGKTYTRSTSQNYTITCKFGEDISSKWPTADNISGNGNTAFYSWQINGQGTDFVSKRFEVTTEMLKNTDNNSHTKYKAHWKSGTKVILHYMLQKPDATGSEYNEDNYTDSEKFYQEAYTSNGFSAKEIYGYTHVSDKNKDINGITNYYFYYNRETHNISYYYKSNKLEVKENIRFGKNINTDTYNYTPATPADLDSKICEFKGWYDNDSCSGEPYNFTTMPANDLKFYAKFAPKEITYKIDKNLGEGTTSVTEYSIPCGKVPEASVFAAPTREGYTFLGWFNGPEDGAIAYDVNAPITSDITIYAHWRLNEFKYRVNYLDAADRTTPVHDNTVDKITGYELGDTFTVKAITVNGYRPDAPYKSMTVKRDITQNVVDFYYSKAQSVKYTVKYVIKGSNTEIRQAEEFTAGASVYQVVKSAPSLLEYNGQNYRVVNNQQTLVLGSNASENIIAFEYEPYIFGKINVHYVCKDWNGLAPINNGDDDIISESINELVGHTFIVGNYVVKKTFDGYTFSEYLNSNKTSVISENTGLVSTKSARNIYVVYYKTAEYKVEHYLQKTNLSGYELKDTETLQGNSGAMTQAEARKNYQGYTAKTFSQEKIKANGETVIKIYYDYTGEYGYTVKYLDKETNEPICNELTTETAKLDTVITGESKKMTITGYTYDSSNPVSITIGTDPNHNVITLFYTRNAHNIIYKIDGEYFANDNYKTINSVKYGDSISIINNDMSKPGYTFSGWSAIPETMPDGDITVTGSYTINKYTVTWKNEDGTVLKTDENVPYGTMPQYNANTPTKAATAEYSYEFAGWTPAVVQVTGNTEYTARFNAVPNNYKVNYNYTYASGDGIPAFPAASYAKPAVETHAFNSKYNIATAWPNFDAKDEYNNVIGTWSFSGWKNGNTVVTGEQTMPASNVALEGEWKYEANKIIYNFVVKYSYSGEVPTNATALPEDRAYTKGQTVNVLDVAAVDGYEFQGWKINDEAVGTSFAMPGNAVELVGNWVRRTAGYTINYYWKDTTVSVKESETGTKNIGDTYAASGLDVSGYTIVPNQTTGGTISAGENVINIYYYKNVTVKAKSQKKVHGDPDPALTATVTGLVGEDSIVYKLSREPGELSNNNNGVNYPIHASGEKYQGKYYVQFEDSVLYINETNLKIHAIDNGKVYGQTDPELKFDIVWTNNNIKPTWNYEIVGNTDGVFTVKLAIKFENIATEYIYFKITREKGEAIGTYKITPIVDNKAQSCYWIADWTDAIFTITKAPISALTVSGTDYTGEYDGQAHGVAATTNITEGTTVSYSTDNGATWNTEVPKIKDAGEITVQVKAENPNYEGVATGSYKLKVTPKHAHVKANATGKVYGDNDPALTATVSGLIGEDTVEYTLARATGETLGTYQITASGTKDQGNYVVDYENDTFTISKAQIVIVPLNGNKNYGDPDPDFVPNLGDFKIRDVNNGGKYKFTVISNVKDKETGKNNVTVRVEWEKTSERQSVPASEDILFSIGRNEGENVGKYPLKSTGDADQGNYKVVYNSVVFIINKAGKLTVSGTNYTGEYDGQAHGVAAVPSISMGTTVSYSTDNGATWSTEVPTITDVGEITVMVKAENKNCDGKGEATGSYKLKVNPKAVTVTADDKSKTYGEADPDLSATVTGLIGTDTLIYSLSRAEGANVGEYTITPAGDEVQGNYAVTYAHGTFTITRSSTGLTVGGTDYTGTYDGEAHGRAATASVTEGTTVSYSTDNGATWSTEVPTITDVGIITVLVSADNSNYVTATGSYTLKVNPKEINVKADNKSKTYGDSDPELTATVTGLVGEETVAYSLARAAGENVGDYVITAAGEATQGNYTVSYENGTLTINAVTDEIIVNITGNTNTVSYSGEEQSISGFTTDVGNKTIDVKLTEGAKAEAKGTNVGEYSMGLTEDSFVVTSSNYNNIKVVVVDGLLNITPSKTLVTISADSLTTVYDGISHGQKAECNVGGIEIIYSTDNGKTWSTEIPTITDAGSITVIAKTNNPNYSEASCEFTIEIAKRKVTLTSATDSKTYDGTALTNSNITVSGEGFVTGEGASYNVTGTQTNAGNSKNTFTYTLNEGTKAANYDITTVEGILTVDKRTVTVIIDVNGGETTYDGDDHTAGGFDVITDDEVINPDDVKYKGDTTVTGKDAGDYDIVLDPDNFYSDDPNIEIKVETVNDGKLVIKPRKVTITSASDEKTYDGKALTNDTVTVSGDGFVSGEGFTANVTGSQTDVGSSDNTFAYTLNEGTKADNYDITVVPGTLTVDKNTTEIVITAASDSKKYDGTALTNAGYTYTKDVLADGDVLTAEISGSQTDAGSSDNVVTSYMVMRGEQNVTAFYTFGESVKGTLEVTQRIVTLTSGTDSKTYDGQPLTNDTITVSGDGFAKGEGAVYDVTGSQTEVGESKNTFTYTLNDGTKATNYDISTVEGTLTVAAKGSVVVTITEHSGNFTYDGEEKKVEGYDVSISDPLYKESDFTFNGTASVSGIDVGTYDMALTADMFKNDNSNFANVSFNIVDGKLVIKPIETKIVIRAASDSKTYDGTALTNNGYTFTENVLVDGDILTAVVEGSQTDAGISDNEVTSYKVMRGNDDVTNNYSFGTSEKGKLEVTKCNVTLTSANLTKTYDGVALTNGETPLTTESGFVDGEGASYSFTGTQLNAGSSANAFTYTLNDGTKAENYNITKTEGILKVDKRSIKVIIVVNDVEAEYDGEEHIGGGFKVVTEDELFDEESVKYNGDSTITETDAGDYPIVLDEDKFSTTDPNFDIEVVVEDGTLSIKPKAIEVKANDGRWEYDSEYHSNPTFTVNGLVGNDKIGSAKMDAKIKYPGTTSNTISDAVFEVGKAKNYAIKYVPGSLEITNRSAKYEIEITAESDTIAQWTKGQSHTVSGYKISSTKGDEKFLSKLASVFRTEASADVIGDNGIHKFEIDGNNFTIEGTKAEKTESECGIYPVYFSGEYIIRDSEGINVNDQFIVKQISGTLTINPTLTINYSYPDGSPVADGIRMEVPYNTNVKEIISPSIEGYTPTIPWFDKYVNEGMTDVDVTTVMYIKNTEIKRDDPIDPDDNDPDEDDPTNPGGGDGGYVYLIEGDDGQWHLVPIDEDAVPLAFRDNSHKDSLLPFLFTFTAFITQLFYNEKRKKHQKKIFEMKEMLATGETKEDKK